MNKILSSSVAVEHKISKMATALLADYAGTQPLFVCLLRGAAPFASKLMFEIARQSPEFHPQLDYMTVKTYGSERHASEPEIVMDLAPSTDLKNRDIIILDDVLDTGVTSTFVATGLRKRGARSTALAVLVEKNIDRPHHLTADYTCFEAGSEWLAGMGMDDTATAPEAYRWLDEIRVVK